MNGGFKDHFSQHAQHYLDARPDYPDQLFDHLVRLAPSRRLAWDCGTGNGQAALALAERFEHVIATDPSVEQIKRAVRHPRVDYCAATAESSCVADQSVALVTAAQAFHWFDAARFCREVQRVTVAGGVLALWCYQLACINPEIDEQVRRLYRDTLGPYWPPERRYVDDGYRSAPFPLDELATHDFHIEKQWDLGQFVRYMASWSATRRFIHARGIDPLQMFTERLARAWGEADGRRSVVWPLKIRVGRKTG